MKRVLHLPGPFANRIAVVLWLGAACGGASFGPQALATSLPAEEAVVRGLAIQTNYHGWTNAILLSNGRVEAIIVPQIGRVMQFRLAGTEHGLFWENNALRGQQADLTSTNWANFGGDRIWPAPFATWDRIMGRPQPPPAGFDGMPYQARVDGWVVTLTGPVDPHYGIRARRTIELAPDAPAMVIRTVFEKVTGHAVEAGVWVATQLQNPVAIATPVPEHSRFREGYKILTGEVPATLKIRNGLLSLKRDPNKPHRIGTDTGTLFWIGDDSVLRIDSPRIPYRTYPDDGCSVQIRTATDAEGGYVELGMLSPQRKLAIGEQQEEISYYTILPRAELDPQLEAQMLWAQGAPRASAL